jgi:hypothetical protein
MLVFVLKEDNWRQNNIRIRLPGVFVFSCYIMLVVK